MWATGMLTGEAMEGGFAGAGLGLECAGRICRVGAGVTDWSPGDEVFALAPWSFSRFTCAPATTVARKPPSLTFEEAATIPAVFCTALYSLCNLAGLKAGERVLIHGAAGGVGLAALQIVRHFGGEVFATAGSEEKRDFLRGLGVEHVFDSRSLTFAENIRAATGGEGVDIVLNSLAGEAMTQSLQLLRPFGRFLEIGKRDFIENSKIGLRPFLENIAYFAVDVDRLMAARPKVMQDLLRKISEHLQRGEFYPLPHRTFPLAHVAQAFRHMQRSRHIGKVVVSWQTQQFAVTNATQDEVKFRQDGTYLVTGGLGGFGLALAEWLSEHGAGHLVLVGRQGAATVESQAVIHELRRAGKSIEVVRADITQREAVAETLARLRLERPPLRGVFHAAMVLDDARLDNLDAARLEKVLAPKVQGAWNLHCLTRHDPLDYFVAFSSISGIVGNPGQANYAAANAFLDALARSRRAAGLPALSVNWGAVAEVGYVAQRPELLQRVASAGLAPLPVKHALRQLGHLLSCSERSQVVVADMNWAQWSSSSHSAPSRPLWQHLIGQGESGQGTENTGRQSLRALLQQTPATERQELLTKRLTDHVARVLGTSRDRVELDRSLAQMGLDSLMAVELRTRVAEDTGLEVSVMNLLQGATVRSLASHLLPLLGDAISSVVNTPVPSHADVSQLSEEEVDNLLAELLAKEMEASPSAASVES
jgi:NADPH:quinone reductase-like Zn-dependent oxidoreductase/acyl carrier protein